MNNLKLIIMSLLFLCVSCSEIIIIDENPLYISQQTSANGNRGYIYLEIEIGNNAVDVTLNIDSVEFDSPYGVLSIPCEKMTVKYQDVVKITDIEWGFNKYKQGSCAVLLHGRVYYQVHTIYRGLIYIPISGSLQPGQNYLKLNLYDGCPWYYQQNGHYYKLLQSIQFDASVDEWKESETIINM